MVIHLFGDILKKLRKEHNLTQEDIANMFNVTKNAVYSWEVGKSQPSIEIIKQLAQYFGVTIDYLLNFTQEDADNMKKLKVALKEAGMWDYDMDDMSKEDFEKAMKIVAMLKEKK